MMGKSGLMLSAILALSGGADFLPIKEPEDTTSAITKDDEESLRRAEVKRARKRARNVNRTR